MSRTCKVRDAGTGRKTEDEGGAAQCDTEGGIVIEVNLRVCRNS